MDNFTEEIINLIESYYILNKILDVDTDHRCEIITNEEAIIILYKNMRIMIVDNSFIFIKIKLKKRLSKRTINKLCAGLCCEVRCRPCMYNKKDVINNITLINITEQQTNIFNFLRVILNLI